jgi:transcriptional regulator with XRE-family HTH domain
MKKELKNPDTSLHIGNLIKQYLTANKISKASLARKMGVSDSTILSYQKNSGLNNSTLIVLSHALRHNFFADIAALLPTTYTTDAPIDSSKDQKIAQLEADLKMARLEIEVLMRVVGK